jgi:Ras family protein T1
MKNCPDGILSNGLTLKGFLTLNSLFIQRGRHETTWTILRKFGFNDDIELDPDALVPSLTPSPGSNVELTHAGMDFLLQVFSKHDRDGDGSLSPQELVSLFSTCPGMPWGPEIYYQVVTNNYGWIGRHGYIALWHLQALINPEKCRQTLAYLGYDYLSPAVASKPSPLALSKGKQGDMAKNQSSKSVYSCLVIGPRDSGKTTFCQTFLGRERPDVSEILASDLPRATINSVTVYGQIKHLVLLDRGMKRQICFLF